MSVQAFTIMEERLTKLESDLAYQQYTIDQLNEVVRSQADAIDALKKEIELLRLELQRKSDSDERDPERERPPHW